MGLRLSDEIAPDMYNYGHFQVIFDDGSLGWYEAGWGPMMSDTAFFVKDVVSNGAVSIRMSEAARSDDIDTHTQTSKLRLHLRRRARSGPVDGGRNRTHQQLCDAEAAFMARAIAEGHGPDAAHAGCGRLAGGLSGGGQSVRDRPASAPDLIRHASFTVLAKPPAWPK